MPISTGANVPKVTVDDIEQARQEIIKRSGRPSLFSPTLAAEICIRLEAGETITKITRDPKMPGISAVNDWRANNPAFAAQFTRARQRSGHAVVDEGRDKIYDMAEPKYEKDEKGEQKLVKPSLADIRLAEMQFKAAMEVAKSYDKETFGNQVQVNQQVTIETMEQRVQRLTGAPMTLNAEWSHVVEIEE